MTERATGGGLGRRILLWIFASIGVLAALAVIWLAVMVAGIGAGRGERETAKVAVKGAAEPYSVQDVRDIPGTSLVQIAIGISGRGSSGSFSRKGGYDFDHRNLILLDNTTGESRRLLTDNKRRIVDVRFLPALAGAEEDKPSAPSAYYVLAVRQLDNDRQDVLVGNIAGGRQAFVLKNIDGIDRMWMLTPNRLAMVVREGMSVHYRVIDVPALKVVLARAVEIG